MIKTSRSGAILSVIFEPKLKKLIGKPTMLYPNVGTKLG